MIHMAEVSTIPAYILANENLLWWMLNHPMKEEILPIHGGPQHRLRTFAYLDFHRWNSTRPDHVFRHRWECFEHEYLKQNHELYIGKKFNTIHEDSKYTSVVLASLKCLADEYLTCRGSKTHVKLELFSWWQNMLSRISALPIRAYSSWAKKREEGIQPPSESLELLYPYDVGVESYISENGLNDSHVHVNLCAYAEECWMYALKNTRNEWIIQDEEFIRSSESEELYREIHPELTPKIMHQHMQIAKRLRYVLICHAFDLELEKVTNSSITSCAERHGVGLTACVKLAKLSPKAPIYWNNGDIDESNGEPGQFGRTASDIQSYIGEEWAWMTKLIQKHAQCPDPMIERAFHMYLLLMNEYMTLCVQRDNCYGFKQFQKYSNTSMSLIASDTYYKSVFQRMHGPSKESIVNYAELRVAPKANVEETKKRVAAILWGYLCYVRSCYGTENLPTSYNCKKLEQILDALDAELVQETQKCRIVKPVIVFHLIKLPWQKGKDGTLSRFGRERCRHNACMQVIGKLLGDYRKLRKWVGGIDAAADEMDTPPDVFASAYRTARFKLKIPKATYHAGEDFYHLVSGMRAVCEAVDLLGLQSGDRIGHATALGINPELWIKTMPNRIAPTRGEWLQDLLFVWNMLHGTSHKNDLLQRLNQDIREHGYIIFQNAHFSPYILSRLFALRNLDSQILLDWYHEITQKLNKQKRNNGVTSSVRLEEVVCYVKEHNSGIEADDYERQLIYKAFCQESADVLRLLIAWHEDPKLWDESERRIEIPIDYFDVFTMQELQQLAMDKLVETGIVVETLPTSNLRISQYKEMGQHHSLRWLGVPHIDGDPPLQIVLGTDDPGIFATDIKAEFYHLFTSLCKRGLNREEALNKLIQVNEAGRVYAFRQLNSNRI